MNSKNRHTHGESGRDLDNDLNCTSFGDPVPSMCCGGRSLTRLHGPFDRIDGEINMYNLQIYIYEGKKM